MILSDSDIKDYISKGLIKISPYDESQVYPASYAFHLGKNLLIPIGNDLIDFKKKLLPEYNEHEIKEEGYTINPGDFILAQTEEQLTLSPQISMFIEGRSSLARIGLEVVQTSSFIEPNTANSIITFEIRNNGKSPIQLYSGMKISRGFFMKLNSPTTQTSKRFGMYSTQNEVKPPHIQAFF